VKTLRLFIASVFLMQGTLCPSLCRAGFMSAPAEDAPCHEMLDSEVVTGGSAGQFLADESADEKKSKSSCCGDEEALLAQSGVRSDGLALDAFELPLLIFVPSSYNILSKRDPPVPLVFDQHRSSPDLQILYSSFLI
jgi:hypothetical protein